MRIEGRTGPKPPPAYGSTSYWKWQGSALSISGHDPYVSWGRFTYRAGFVGNTCCHLLTGETEYRDPERQLLTLSLSHISE